MLTWSIGGRRVTQFGVQRALPACWVLFHAVHSSQWTAPVSISQQLTGQTQTFRGESCNWIVINCEWKFPLPAGQMQGCFSQGSHFNTNRVAKRDDKIIDPSDRQKLEWINTFLYQKFKRKIFLIKCVMIHPEACRIISIHRVFNSYSWLRSEMTVY